MNIKVAVCILWSLSLLYSNGCPWYLDIEWPLPWLGGKALYMKDICDMPPVSQWLGKGRCARTVIAEMGSMVAQVHNMPKTMLKTTSNYLHKQSLKYRSDAPPSQDILSSTHEMRAWPLSKHAFRSRLCHRPTSSTICQHVCFGRQAARNLSYRGGNILIFDVI